VATLRGAVVDTASAQEFYQEIRPALSETEAAAIAAELERKSALFAATLARPAAPPAHAEVRALLRCVFGARRSADRILDAVGAPALAAAIDDLLHSGDDLPVRLERFDALLAQFPEQGFDLPGELLHFTYPDRYWLWTRWIWDPRADTGALRLVTTEETDLDGGGRGATYLAVGQAMVFVHETAAAAGFSTGGHGLFGTDVFLAAVYGVYMNTVLRMRMTQEFTRMVPDLPNLVRRLLGVHYLPAEEVETCR
jgi:hypothetical protein